MSIVSKLTTALCFCVAFSGSVQAEPFESLWDKERFQIRVRGLGIIADGDGSVDATNLKTDVGNAVTPEIDFTYFFTKNIAAEAVVATAQHSLNAGNLDLGQTWILPPTLVLQYHFTPDKKFSPYVGAGLNYSIFYGEDANSGFTDLNVGNGLGFAAQAGFDYWMNDNWGLNFDVKYIDLDVDVSLNDGAVVADDVDIDPVIIGAGISYRF